MPALYAAVKARRSLSVGVASVEYKFVSGDEEGCFILAKDEAEPLVCAVVMQVYFLVGGQRLNDRYECL